MSEAPEFNLDAILDGAKHTQRTITLYLDGAAASEAVDANLRLLESQGDPEPDTAEKAQKALDEVLERLESQALKVTLRALATEEINVIRRVVVKENPIPKNESEELKKLRETERTELAMVHLLSNAVIGVVGPDGSKAKGLSVAQIASLREKLPAAEWDKLTKNFDEVQSGTAVFEGLISDPTFRWGLPD